MKLSYCLLLLLLLLVEVELLFVVAVVVVVAVVGVVAARGGGVVVVGFVRYLSLVFVLHQNETLYEDKKPFHTTICTVLCSRRSIDCCRSPTLVSASNSKPISFYP